MEGVFLLWKLLCCIISLPMCYFTRLDQAAVPLGCYLIGSSFDELVEVEILDVVDGMTVTYCIDFCNMFAKNKGLYTYAGLSGERKCHCFNTLLVMKRTVGENCKRHCLGLGDDSPCNNRFTVDVYRTCPQHAFAPPYCAGRCPSYCKESACFANGTCEYGCREEHANYMSQETQILPGYQSDIVTESQTDTYGQPHEPRLTVYPTWGKLQAPGFVHKISYLSRPPGFFFVSFWEQANDEVKITLKGKHKLHSTYPGISVQEVAVRTRVFLEAGDVLGVHFDESLRDHYDYNITLMQTQTGLYSSRQEAVGAEVGYIIDDYDFYDSGDEDLGWTPGLTLPNENGTLHEVTDSPSTAFMTVHVRSKCPVMCAKEECDTSLKCVHGCQPGFMGPDCSEKCPVQKYGPNCEMWCRTKCKDELCHSSTGVCSHGCVAGFNGPFCDKPCPPGFFGENCAQPCTENCFDAYHCHKENGSCIEGCKAGYHLPMCNETCPENTYGENCLLRCGECRGSAPCDPVSGACPDGCQDDYNPPLCACLKGYFGPECEHSCGECAGGIDCSCDGTCREGCASSRQPPYCLCEFGWYGWECQHSCDFCQGGLCSPFDGSCLEGCNPGYTGPGCKERCEPGSYGSGCRETCGACSGGKNECNVTSGHCVDGCEDGYQAPLCQQCMAGRYGDRCEASCGQCEGGRKCDSTGQCPGGCADHEEPPQCVCPRHMFGAECTERCGYCTGDINCLVTGQCLDGCMPGYMGALCNETCSEGRYGVNCGSVCSEHCVDQACHYETGECLLGCADGFIMPRCECQQNFYMQHGLCVECGHCSLQCQDDGSCPGECLQGYKLPTCRCPINTYGPGCSNSCGFCAGDEECDAVTGECPQGCLTGFVPPLCQDYCPHGFYGDGCRKPCGACKDQQTCDPETGICNGGCHAGYQPGKFCELKCALNHWGKDCLNTCGACKNSTGCHHVTGECILGCETGYEPPFCVETCRDGYYGHYCDSVCGRCLGNTTCNVFTGQCPEGCTDGYHPPLCTVPGNITTAEDALTLANKCPVGYFGPRCKELCGNCDTYHCDSRGVCQGQCQRGYKPPVCIYPCDPGFYGVDCLRKCGHCHDSGVCDHRNGHCPFGCEEGFKKPFCAPENIERIRSRKPTYRRFLFSRGQQTSFSLVGWLLSVLTFLV